MMGPLVIKIKKFHDERGVFFESYRANTYAARGIAPFVQENISLSQKGVLRGLHFQNPHPQGKLLTVLSGSIYDVCVDLRPSSPTFGQYLSIDLTAQADEHFYVPPGFAHGFCALADNTLVQYQCTDYYAPQAEKTLLWNDPTINIPWPLTNPLLSAKDQAGRVLTAFNDADLKF